jgi:hypothetical protein
MGGIGALFFGACAWFIGKKIRANEPGLIVEPGGFSDRSSATAVGWVPWSDIDHLSVVEVQGNRFILVQVRNPDTYLARAGGLARKAMEMNARLYGSPVFLSATGLQVSFDELFRVIKQGLDRYQGAGG